MLKYRLAAPKHGTDAPMDNRSELTSYGASVGLGRWEQRQNRHHNLLEADIKRPCGYVPTPNIALAKRHGLFWTNLLDHQQKGRHRL